MKKKLKIAFISFAVLVSAIWVISKMTFAESITQAVEAVIYIDGKPAGTTMVSADGTINNYLFEDEQYFIGSFFIEYYERTCREDMQAVITWREHADQQTIEYSQNATYPDLELKLDLYINREMNEFALGFNDGTIIATSDEMYQKYAFQRMQ